jgi:predicted kinase
MMKTLYLIRGLPGSGKTTLARMIQTYMEDHYYDSSHYEADMYHINKDGKYEWRPENVPHAHSWCKVQTEEAMIKGDDCIIISNTFTQMWEIAPYIELANRYGYQVQGIIVATDLTDEQLAVRNHHSVPVESIRKMRERWEQ